MVVTPFDALADVAAVWKAAGGVWHPSDAVHFEYPGFKVPAVPDSDKTYTVSVIDLWNVFVGPGNVDMGLLETLATMFVRPTISIPYEMARSIFNAKPGELNELARNLIQWATRF